MNNQIDTEGTVIQHGGVTRYVHGPAAPTPQETIQGPSVRVAGQVYRYVAGQEVQTMGVARHQEGLPSQANTGSVMATLKRHGGVQTVELDPGNPASRTRIQTAVRDGLVREISQGIYADTGIAPEPQPMQSPDSSGDDQEGSEEAAPFAWVDPKDMALLNEDLAPIAQHAFDSAKASMVALVSTGKGSLESIADRLAASEGMEPALAQEYVTQVSALYKDNLSRDLVKTAGLPKGQVEQFYQWAQGKPQLPKAVSQLMHEGKPAEFRSMVLTFKRELAGKVDTSAFKARGFETRTDRDTGDILIRQPGKNWVKVRDL